MLGFVGRDGEEEKKRNHGHVALDDDGAPNFNVVVDFKVAVDGQFAKNFDLSSGYGGIVSTSWAFSALLPIGKEENDGREEKEIGYTYPQQT